MKTLVLFDFDGTITSKDSLIEFIKYVVGKPSYYFGLFLLSPMLVAYTLKLIKNYKAKEKLISYFFKGWDKNTFQNIADQYSTEEIENIVRPNAMNKLRWHQDQGHQVVVVSASMDNWLNQWCACHQLELLATSLEIKNNKISGKFATKNCYGIEKVNRIKEQYNLSDYDVIYAYGDSKGDKEMLNIANKKHYKYFD